MAIIYRTAGAWGAGNGANLTPAQVDGNFWDLHGRVDTLETTPPAPNNIANISASGSQMTITMDDASTFTVTMPTARLTWTGDWADATAYGVNNVFADPDTGNIYIVIKGHTSAATFDPDATSGGDPVYELMISAAAGGGAYIADVVLLPATSTGSATVTPTLDQANYLFLTNDSVEGGYTTLTLPTNASVAFPVGTCIHLMEFQYQGEFGAAGGVDVFGVNFSTKGTRGYGAMITAVKIATDEWQVIGDAQINNVATVSTTTLTLPGFRRGGYLNFTHASGCTVTLELDSAADYRAGDEFQLRQGGAGAVTLDFPTGVTVLSKAGTTYSTLAEGSVMTLKYIGSDVWHLFGDHD
jgi:hypothetical protein